METKELLSVFEFRFKEGHWKEVPQFIQDLANQMNCSVASEKVQIEALYLQLIQEYQLRKRLEQKFNLSQAINECLRGSKNPIESFSAPVCEPYTGEGKPTIEQELEMALLALVRSECARKDLSVLLDDFYKEVKVGEMLLEKEAWKRKYANMEKKFLTVQAQVQELVIDIKNIWEAMD